MYVCILQAYVTGYAPCYKAITLFDYRMFVMFIGSVVYEV